MKGARLWILLPGVVCLTLWAISCSSPNKSKKVGWDSDTAAVRAILDANGLTGIAATKVGEPPEDAQTSSEYRVVRLVLTADKLGGSKLDTLPADIGELTSLTFVTLDSNQITQLPSAIGKLKNVTTFSAAGNALSSLPSEIGDMESLRNLKLGGNELSSIPSSIGQLDSLEDLVLSENKLQSVPSELADLSALRKLHLDNNVLTADGLPGRLTELDSLDWLNVENNRICSPGEGIDAWLDSYHGGEAWKTSQVCP